MKSLIHILTEANIKDISTKGYNAFISDYTDVYDKSLYVVFSNNQQGEFAKSNIKPFTEAMIAFPISYVLRNQVKFASIKSKYITIIRLNIGSSEYIKINEVVIPEVKQAYLDNGYTEDQFNTLFLKTRFTTSMNVASKMLLDLIKIKKLYTNKLHVIYDTTKSLSKSILSNEYASIAFILKPSTYRYVTHYNNNNLVDNLVGNQNNIKEKSMRKMAAFVSESLGSKLSSDKEVKMFMDYIFWTNDGIELKITKILSSDKSINSDGTYFVIEADTPNGILLHTTNTTDTFEEISNQVKEKYEKLSTPNSLWEPQSRDLFLTGERYDYKNFDVEREKFVKTVEKYYPMMRHFGRRYKIELPILDKFTTLDKAVIYHIVDAFIKQQDNPLKVIEELIENNTNVRTFIGLPASNQIDIGLIKSITMIYVAAKKLNPVKSGWHIFQNI